MTDPTSPNAEQIRHWNEINGPRWAALQGRLDAQLDPVGLSAMERLTLPSDARVLDVGCGCGSTTIELAQRLATSGAVTGVDISGPLLARAIERAADAAIANVRFVQADAQTFAFEEGSFDAVFSRFGVMFFADPVAAFANLRRALKPRGVITFVCWRNAKENAWVTVPMMAALPFLEAPTPPAPGTPGPFSLADRERLTSVLSAAGFADISIEADNPKLLLGGGSDLDATVDFALQIGPTAALLREQSVERVDEVRAAVRAALAPYQTADGIALGAAIWIVRAARP